MVEAGPDSVRSAVRTALDFVCLRRNGHPWARVRSRAGSFGHHGRLPCLAPRLGNASFCTCRRAGSNEYSSPSPERRGQPARVRSPHPRERIWATIQSAWVSISSSPPLLGSRSLGPLAWLRRPERKGLFDVRPRERLGRAGERERLARARRADRASAEQPALPGPGRRRGLGPAGEPVCIHAEEVNALLGKPGPLLLQPFAFSAQVFFSLHTSLLSHDPGPSLQARGRGWGAGEARETALPGPFCVSTSRWPPWPRRKPRRGLRDLPGRVAGERCGAG